MRTGPSAEAVDWESRNTRIAGQVSKRLIVWLVVKSRGERPGKPKEIIDERPMLPTLVGAEKPNEAGIATVRNPADWGSPPLVGKSVSAKRRRATKHDVDHPATAVSNPVQRKISAMQSERTLRFWRNAVYRGPCFSTH